MKTNKQSGGDFLQDLERNHLQSSCTVWMVLLFLCFIFLSVISILLIARGGYFNRFPDISVANISNREKEKLELPPMIETGETKVNITEEELTKAIKSKEFSLKDPSISIKKDGLFLEGRTGASFLSLRVRVKLMPRVVGGKVKFDINEITTAGLSAPPAVTKAVESNLQQWLDQPIPQVNDYTVEEVKLFDKYSEVTISK